MVLALIAKDEEGVACFLKAPPPRPGHEHASVSEYSPSECQSPQKIPTLDQSQALYLFPAIIYTHLLSLQSKEGGLDEEKQGS